MIQIPAQLLSRYTAFITHKDVAPSTQKYYVKWLRYYLDFCHKYSFAQADGESLSAFDAKLRGKKQNERQREQAHHAVSLYYGLLANSKTKAPIKYPHDNGTKKRSLPNAHFHHTQQTTYYLKNQPDENSSLPSGKPSLLKQEKYKQSGADWTEIFRDLKNAIQMRHYSPATLRTYTGWTRKFQTYVRSKDPRLLEVDNVKSFLTWLAVDQGVSASSQNQAFNALLFLFRHVFEREFGKVDGIVRAKRKPYIPVVLSREEVHRVIGFLEHPYKLIISLMYGCGLRISECLSLRVHNFNFDMKVLTVHDGKGKKDRTVLIPDALMDDLQDQLERVVELHGRDSRADFDGVFLYGLLEKKYRNAARELTWQWFFPARDLTVIPETGQRRRYHIHETALQKALRRAVRKAGIPKRITSHTFRHSFASHLLQANYDIRTIQELLGHSDVRTTMIYTHTVQSRTLKEARSPLDFS